MFVIKIPKAKKQPSGNWFIQMRLDGESIPITALTEKECIRRATLIKAEYKADRRIQRAAGITLREAIDKYIKYRENILSPSTIRGYRIIQRNRFTGIMDNPISKINDWQRICNDEASFVSARTLRNSWLFIVSVLKENNIIAPKVVLPQIIKEERKFLEPEQITKFIKLLKGKDFEIPALLALHSLRISEILALTIDNIDLENLIIHVRGSVVPNEHNILEYKKSNKNESSRRDIPIFIPELVRALKTNENIISIKTDLIRKNINMLCRENNLPQIGIHGLRHSFASLAYHLKIPEAYTMQIGGWSDYATMRNIYTHLAKKDAIKSDDALRKFFNNANDI